MATLLGALTAWAFGWGGAAGVVYGLAISVASTVVLTRVLVDHNDLHTPTGHIAVGWLVVEDLAIKRREMMAHQDQVAKLSKISPEMMAAVAAEVRAG